MLSPVNRTDSTSTYDPSAVIDTYPLSLEIASDVEPLWVRATASFVSVTSSDTDIVPRSATSPVVPSLVSVRMSTSLLSPMLSPVNRTDSTCTNPFSLVMFSPLYSSASATWNIPVEVFVMVMSADMSYPPRVVNDPFTVTAASNVASSLKTLVESTWRLVSTSTVPFDRRRICCVAAPAPLVLERVPKTRSPIVSPPASVCSYAITAGGLCCSPLPT